MKKVPVVYLEDDQNSLEIVHFILSVIMGFENVHVWDSSANVLEKVRKLPQLPGLILLDIHMDPLDGFAVMKLLRQQQEFKEVRIVALTASFMKEEVSTLKSAGFDGGIAKPIDRDTFPTIVERILNGEEVWDVAGTGSP
ncbi:MAG: response regulator [Chloroflexota bacterium]